MPTITVCSSAHFYKHVIEVKKQLEAKGYSVLVPKVALRMEETGDYQVEHYKTWYADPNDYDKKEALMREHFDKIVEGDAILVVNDQKHGLDNYIGGNVLMEMAVAFFLKKPIFILFDLPEPSPFTEEFVGMRPVLLHGDVTKLKLK
jgi:hypothetical protein